MRKIFIAILLTSCGDNSSLTPADPINISVFLTASSDAVEVESSVILTWSSSFSTSCSASGSWSGSKEISGTQSVTLRAGGSNIFVLTCYASGANSGDASTTVNGLRYFDGTVFDGYVRGAEVFIDTDNSLSIDNSEESVVSDNQGMFTRLLFTNGALVSKGGFDLDTGAELSNLFLVHKLEGFEKSKLVSPFTTLIAYMDEPSNLNALIGIDASIDLLRTDPIPNLGIEIYNNMYEKGNQLTILAYTLQNLINDTESFTEIYFRAIADELEESYLSSKAIVDLEDSEFISKVINRVEMTREKVFSVELKSNLNTVLSSVIPILQVYANKNITSAVQRFAFDTMQNDVKNSMMMNNSSSSTLLKYENNIFKYIADDQGIDESAINPEFNYPPIFTSSTFFIAPENQTAIGIMSASDADADVLIFTISHSEINISPTGVLAFVTAPDYETKRTYSAIVTVSDGYNYVSQSININIDNIEEPGTNLVAQEKGIIDGQITYEDISREFILYVPASYSSYSKKPLVFNFHGYTSSANEYITYGDLRPQADTNGFILVYPNALKDSQDKSYWNIGGWSTSIHDDTKFIKNLISVLVNKYSIDEKRIYSTGFSNGGFFSFHLACNLNESFAAIASVAGSMTPDTFKECIPKKPLPVLQIHGLVDPTVPYSGTTVLGVRNSSKPVLEVMEYWKNNNNCDQYILSNGQNSGDGESRTDTYEYSNCLNGTQNIHLLINSAGHIWPGSASVNIQSPNASKIIWDFFSKYDINGVIQ